MKNPARFEYFEAETEAEALSHLRTNTAAPADDPTAYGIQHATQIAAALTSSLYFA